MKVWVVEWSENDEGFIQPAGKTYHKSPNHLKKFIANTSNSLMPVSISETVVGQMIFDCVTAHGVYEDWR